MHAQKFPRAPSATVAVLPIRCGARRHEQCEARFTHPRRRAARPRCTPVIAVPGEVDDSEASAGRQTHRAAGPAADGAAVAALDFMPSGVVERSVVERPFVAVDLQAADAQPEPPIIAIGEFSVGRNERARAQLDAPATFRQREAEAPLAESDRQDAPAVGENMRVGVPPCRDALLRRLTLQLKVRNRRMV